MQVKGLDRDQVREIVDQISKRQFAGNLIFEREPEVYRGGVRFTLRVRDSRGPGHRRGFAGYDGRPPRRLIAACFHAYGEVIRALLDAGAERIDTAPARAERRKGKDRGGVWGPGEFHRMAARIGDRNIGSMMAPMRFRDACDCGVGDMPPRGYDYAARQWADGLRGAPVRVMRQADMLRCEHVIMLPEHYREDGSCKCDSRSHRAMMIREWGYSEADFAAPATRA